jgi:hypothetical protein
MIKYQAFTLRKIKRLSVGMHTEMTEYGLDADPAGVVVLRDSRICLHSSQCNLKIRKANQCLARNAALPFRVASKFFEFSINLEFYRPCRRYDRSR